MAAKLAPQSAQMDNGNDLRTAISLKAKSILDLLLGEVREQKGIKTLLEKKKNIDELDYDVARDPDAYF
jgi:hypothetical protein